jgi:hypothetical protein
MATMFHFTFFSGAINLTYLHWTCIGYLKPTQQFSNQKPKVIIPLIRKILFF